MEKITWQHTLREIREKQEGLNKKFETAKARALRKYGDAMNEMGVKKWADGPLADQRMRMLQSEYYGRVDVARKPLEAGLRDLRRFAETLVPDIETRIKAERYKKIHADDPKTPAEWQEAKARREFILRELEATGPIGMRETIAAYESNADKWGLWLARDVAAKLLEPMARASEPGALSLLSEIRRATAGDADAARDAATTELKSLLAAIRAPVSDAETKTMVERLGVRVYDTVDFDGALEPIGEDGADFSAAEASVRLPRRF